VDRIAESGRDEAAPSKVQGNASPLTVLWDKAEFGCCEVQKINRYVCKEKEERRKKRYEGKVTFIDVTR